MATRVCAKVTTAVLVLGCLGLTGAAQGLRSVQVSPYPLLAQPYTRADGLASDYINAALQDRNGYLWFATDRGVSRYDGTQFTNYSVDEGLPGNLVYALYEDARGRIWASTFEQGLACNTGGGFAPFPGSGPAAEALQTVSALAGDTLGGLFALTPTGLVAVAPDSTARLVLQPRSTSDRITLAPLQHGCIATRGAELFYYPQHDTPPIPLTLPAAVAIAGGGPLKALSLGGNRVLLQHGDTAYRLRLQTDSLVLEARYPFTGESAYFLDGQLYIGNRQDGLVTADSSQQLRYGTAEGLPVAYVTHIAPDYEGGIWITTFGGGAVRLQPGGGRWLQAPNHLHGNKVSCLYRTRSGHLWIGTDGGYTVYYNGACTAQSSENSSYFTLRAMAELPDGSLVMGTYTQLLRAPSVAAALRGQWQKVAEMANGIASLVAQPDGSLWVGTYGSGLVVLASGASQSVAIPNVRTNGSWRATAHYHTDSGLAENMVEKLVPSSQGLWVLHAAGGAARFQNGHWYPVQRAAGLPSTTVNCVYEDPRGVTWLGTQKGIAYLRNDSLFTLPAAQLPPDLAGRPIRAIFAAPTAAAPAAVAWVLTDQQLFSIEKNESGYFARRAGTWLQLPGPAPSVNRVWVDAQRLELIVGTTRGVLVYDLRTLQHAAVPPRVRITEVRLDGEALPTTTETLEVPAAHQALTLRVAGLSFLGTVPIQYRFRLQGLEEDFGPPTTVPEATYRNLPDGTYTFQVLALNADGVVSAAPATLRFRVAPPFFKQTWFRLLFILGVLGGVAAVVRYYARRQLLRRIRALEIQRRLDAERERISRDLHDNIGAQLTSILSGLEFSERLGAQQNPRLSDLVAALKQDARMTISQLRDTIWALRQPAISVAGFLEQFGTFVARQLQYEEALTYEQQGEQLADLKLRPVQALALFRVLQEALQNTRKHAGATRITLAAERPALDRLVFTYHDNGKGMALADEDLTHAGHYGLSNMALRMDELGGTFTVHSAPGQGTTLVFAVPLQPEKANRSTQDN